MSELIGWVIVLGLAIAIACFFMLSRQLDTHMRNTVEIMIQSNEMILARLEQLANPSVRAPETMIGVVLERRRAQRVDPLTQGIENPVKVGPTAGRRLGDLPSAGEAGGLPL